MLHALHKVLRPCIDSITDGYMIRRKAVDFSTCLISDINLAKYTVMGLKRGRTQGVKAWDQYGA